MAVAWSTVLAQAEEVWRKVIREGRDEYSDINENPDCSICGTVMCWHDLTVGRVLAISVRDRERAARLLVCMKDDCVNGWDATQKRMRWE